MLTCSKVQQQLGIGASHLPTHTLYGYVNSATLLHPRVTALREEHWLDGNASSSPFLPLMQTWTYRTCDQPLFGALYVKTSTTTTSIKYFIFTFQVLMAFLTWRKILLWLNWLKDCMPMRHQNFSPQLFWNGKENYQFLAMKMKFIW